ncbi:hypothetical protein IFM89_030484 [Coptis chinensis]|uniref:3'-5' exonuclease domain-containing protein n=1 Tax=Coptis chinensis TaxID=261450 RepID=A0A835LGY7_9MAGN|nr:hypothetical protein IFM89_030484 [Coptis chinensis]
MESQNISISELRTQNPNLRIYTIKFFDKRFTTTVTSSPYEIRKWIRSTWYHYSAYRTQLIVGLGVQWNPDSDNNNPADTLQLCVGSRCLIIQLSQTDYVPELLRRFLGDTDTTFVGIWNHSDESRLEQCEHKLVLGSEPIDLRYKVADRFGEYELQRASMESLVGRFFGYHGVGKDPNVARSEWDADWLDDEQVLYASVDAFVSFQMGKEMGL